jgi:type I restriction enzyme M protein
MPRRHRPGVSATSTLAHVEEVILATSGEDAFELVLAVAAARLLQEGTRSVDRGAIGRVARRHPALDLRIPEVDAALVTRVDALLGRVLPHGDGTLAALDAVFESLVSRVAKGNKGQFFTPRHVIDTTVRLLRPKRGELVADPSCGSGAFLGHASRASAGVRTWGCDVDARAVRVARLFALASGRSAEEVVRGDGLHVKAPKADVVATNPPFAGRAPADGFDVARVVRAPERDVLFLERALDLLRPGGRLGIVLPYNKANGQAYAAMRAWLVERARVFAVLGLPKETFLPHTSQRTFVLFAKKRAKVGSGRGEERIAFVVSERAGKDAAGELLLGEDGRVAHDLAPVEEELAPFLEAEGFFR